jgi:hypothetical protein
MSHNLSPSETLALRREALVAQCGMQRLMLVAEVRTILAPIAPSGWRQHLSPRLKVPLAIAGVVVGLLITKPSRAMPLLQLGGMVWGIARTVLPILRRAGPDSGE